MSIEPTVEEQQLLEETFRRAGSRMTAREVVAGGLSGAGFAAAVAGLWTLLPPGSFALLPAVICLVVFAIATRVRFDTPLGFTVPTQLAFVPLVFAVPVAIVPIATALAFVVAQVPAVASREMPPTRLLLQPTNAWFAVGPAAVLAIAHLQPETAGQRLLIAALLAQFTMDEFGAAVYVAIARDGSFASLLQANWVYAIDAALSGVGFVVAREIRTAPLAALSLVPLLGLLTVFARERRRRLESMLELSSAYRGTALVLGDVIEADDGYTGEHCKSVVALTLEVAEHLALSPERQRNLEFAALLHDVGKIAIPKEIINKPGKLDPHEWTIIKTHTLEGQKMLDRVGGFMREVGRIVRSHHERWDGGGYPDGVAGEEIPLEARIISCCDTWNAMRTDRPYRKALPYDVAMTELLSISGTQLDPTIVEALLHVVAAEAPATAGAAPTVDAPAADAAAVDAPGAGAPVGATEPISRDAAGAPQPQPAYG